MKTLYEFIQEELFQPFFEDYDFINEGQSQVLFKHNGRYDFDLITNGGHADERETERRVSDKEIVELVKDCWSRIKKGIENGQILIKQPNSGKSGSQFCLHSSEKTPYGYLSVACFILNKSVWHKQEYYTIFVKTVFKGKEQLSWYNGDEHGKKMHHPERGQLDLWDTKGITYQNREDVMVVKGGVTSEPKQKPQHQQIKVVGFVDLDKISNK